MRLGFTSVVMATLLVELGSCSLFVDTSGLSNGAKDAGNPSDSSIASETSATLDASDEDAADAMVGPSSTLVQERGTSASSTTTLMISLAETVTPGNSLLLVAAGSEEDPTDVSGGGPSWNQLGRSGTHVATSMWLATGAPGGDTPVTVTWSATETTAAVLLMEWTGTLKKVLDVEGNGSGADVNTGPIASSPGEILVAAVGMHNHAVGAPSGGFDLVDSVARDDLQLLVAKSAPGAGNFSAGWTAVTADGWDSIFVALEGN